MDNYVMKPMEMPEPAESSEQIDMQRLNDSTFEPGSVVEQSGDYRQSEVIQTGLTAVVDNLTTMVVEPRTVIGEVACDGSSKEPVYTERGAAIPEPISQAGEPAYGIETGPTSKTTIQFNDGSGGAIPAGGTGVTGTYVTAEGGIRTPAEGVAAIPEPIPEPTRPISAIPDPIPEPMGPISAIPDPIPEPIRPISAIPDPIPEPRGDISSSPLPQPVPEPREFVSAIPDPIPQPANNPAEMPVPLPEPGGFFSDLPGPLPRPAGDVSTIPGPLPEPGGFFSDIPGPLPSPAGDVSTLPGPLPEPGGFISDIPGPLPRPAGDVSTIPGPLPGPAGDVSGLPIPIPRPEGGDESLRVSIPEGDVNALSQGIEEGPLKGSPGEDGGENITPINLPHIGEVVEEKTISSAAEGTFDKTMSEDIFTPIPGIEETAYGESLSQVKEPFGTGDLPLPATAAEALVRGTSVLDTAGMADRMVQNTLSGLENLETYGSAYQTQEAMTGMTILHDVAAYTLRGRLEIPGNLPTPTYGAGGTTTATESEGMEGVQIPLQPGTEVEETPPATIETTIPLNPTVESTGETGEEWTPLEMYVYYGSDGKLVVVDASGKPMDSPPTVSSMDGVQFFAYYPGLVDKEGNTIKFDITTYKGSLENINYYTDSQGKMIAVDANGKALDSPPIVTSPTGAPPYYAYYPGMVDESGNTIKVEVQSYKGSLENIYYYTDSQGKMTAVDANGHALDSPPIVTSPTGAPPYYAYYPGMVDESGNTIKVEVQSYKGSLENIFYYTDSQGKMIAVDVNGKTLNSPPTVNSPTGAPPYYAYYPGMVDENGNTVKVEVQSYKGSLDNIFYYTDSQGKMIAVDANGKAIESPPIVNSPNGAPPYYAYYPGMVDGIGNTIKVEIQAYHPPSASKPAAPA